MTANKKSTRRAWRDPDDAPNLSTRKWRARLEQADVMAGKKVVRLKGGDPLIFGRAGEEMQALREAGVPCEIVPGVTAATAASAAAGLPLTHRDHSSAVVFVTGHQCAANTNALDWAALAQLRATLCFYMGVRRLPEIARNLLGHGLRCALGSAYDDAQRRAVSPFHGHGLPFLPGPPD